MLSGSEQTARARAVDEGCDPSGCRVLLEGLRYEIDGHLILDGLSAEISTRRVGVVGRNGSGKSTLARILAGLVRPGAGAALLNGIDPAKDRKAALRQVGILFQNPDHQIIFPTVIEEITFGLRQLGRGKAAARDGALAVLAEFGKAHWAEAHVATLSQGQKHLLCLMAVIAMRPALIILDEPFTGLDIPTRMQLHRHLARYQGSLIHITHDPEDLRGYDEILWLEQGRIARRGPMDEVLPVYVAAMTEQGKRDDLSDLPG